MRIILASRSPIRKALMDLITTNYEVIVSNADEEHIGNLSIEEESKRLAYIKAKKVFSETCGDRIVIGSDTMILKNNKVYEKPKDEQDAKRMLQELQGSKYEAITSLCVLVENNGEYIEYIDYDKTTVYLKNVSDEEIDKYIKTGEALNKAGAHNAQGKFCVFVDKIEGNPTTIGGMPMHKLYDILKKYI